MNISFFSLKGCYKNIQFDKAADLERQLFQVEHQEKIRVIQTAIFSALPTITALTTIVLTAHFFYLFPNPTQIPLKITILCALCVSTLALLGLFFSRQNQTFIYVELTAPKKLALLHKLHKPLTEHDLTMEILHLNITLLPVELHSAFSADQITAMQESSQSKPEHLAHAYKKMSENNLKGLGQKVG